MLVDKTGTCWWFKEDMTFLVNEYGNVYEKQSESTFLRCISGEAILLKEMELKYLENGFCKICLDKCIYDICTECRWGGLRDAELKDMGLKDMNLKRKLKKIDSLEYKRFKSIRHKEFLRIVNQRLGKYFRYEKWKFYTDYIKGYISETYFLRNIEREILEQKEKQDLIKNIKILYKTRILRKKAIKGQLRLKK